MCACNGGNEDSTTPEWTGLGRDDWPAGFEPGDRHPDPFADDEPLFTITSDNYKDYADQLSTGQKALFERYPDTYKMKVYPSRRTASFPQNVYDASQDNRSEEHTSELQS